MIAKTDRGTTELPTVKNKEPIHILAVDDEPMLLDITKLFLEKQGEFTVRTTDSAKEALLQLRSGTYDAIVSDYDMPNMNGIELLKEVRKINSEIPFIIFTGRGREDVVIDALNYGADFYIQKGGLPKPQFAELAHKINQAVDKRRFAIGLKRSEQRLYDIFNHLPDPTVAIDLDGRVIGWNRAMVEMTGISVNEIINRENYSYSKAIYGKIHPILIDLILDPEAPITNAYTIQHWDGDYITAETDITFAEGDIHTFWIKATPMYDENGKIAGAISSARDITAKKKSEEALKKANEYNRSLIEAHIDPLLTIDITGRIIDVNRAMEQLTGYSCDLLTGSDFCRCFREQDMAEKSFFEVMQGHTVMECPLTVVAADNSTIPILLFASPYKNPEGVIMGVFAEVHDVPGFRKIKEQKQIF